MTLDDSILPPVTIRGTGGGASNADFGVNEGRRFIPTAVEVGVTVGVGGREEGVDLGAEAAGVTVEVTVGGRVDDLGVEEVVDLGVEAPVGVTEGREEVVERGVAAAVDRGVEVEVDFGVEIEAARGVTAVFGVVLGVDLGVDLGVEAVDDRGVEVVDNFGVGFGVIFDVCLTTSFPMGRMGTFGGVLEAKEGLSV